MDVEEVAASYSPAAAAAAVPIDATERASDVVKRTRDDEEDVVFGANGLSIVNKSSLPDEFNADIVAKQNGDAAQRFFKSVSSPPMLYSQALALPFDAYREELVKRYASKPELSGALAKAETPDQLLSTLNSRETRGLTHEELQMASRLRVDLQDQGRLERIKKTVLDRYTIVDPVSGESVVANMRNETHVELLKQKFAETIETKRYSAQRTAMMNEMAQLNMMGASLGKLQLKLKEESEQELPTPNERSQRMHAVVEAHIDAQVNSAATAIAELNNVVSLPEDEAHTVQIRANTVDFAEQAVNYFPLQRDVLHAAQAQYMTQLLNSLTFWNAYPTVLFESSLRLIMFGKKTYRTTSSYNYMQFVHCMYLWVSGSEVRPNHAAFLEEETRACHELQAIAIKERTELSAGIEASGDTVDQSVIAARYESVTRTLEDIAFMARSIGLARAAFSRGEIVSPFNEYLTRPAHMGGPMLQNEIPRHSKDEIAKIVATASEKIDETFHFRLEEIENRYRRTLTAPDLTPADRPVAAFLREVWLLNHTFTVESVRCFDLGLLMLYEKGIPMEYRRNFAAKIDIVPAGTHNGYTLRAVQEQVQQDRRFFTTVRRHCANYVRELLASRNELHKITAVGLRFPDEDVDAISALEIEAGQAMSPTFGEFYDFYVLVTTDYADCLPLVVDEMDRVYKMIYNDDGSLKPEHLTIIASLEFKNNEIKAAEKRRRKE
jgi:hypothetical protein